MARTKEFDERLALERAMQLFWCQGYDATSIQDLVDRLGIGRGSLYGTFGDKRSLYLAALDRYEQVVLAGQEVLLDAPGSALAAIRNVFTQTVDGILTDPARRGCLAVNAAVELAPHDREVAARVATIRARSTMAFERAARRAQTAGELASSHDPRALARFLANALNGLQVQAKAGPDEATLRDTMTVTLSVLS